MQAQSNNLQQVVSFFRLEAQETANKDVRPPVSSNNTKGTKGTKGTKSTKGTKGVKLLASQYA
jgi:hypothetical protein